MLNITKSRIDPVFTLDFVHVNNLAPESAKQTWTLLKINGRYDSFTTTEDDKRVHILRNRQDEGERSSDRTRLGLHARPHRPLCLDPLGLGCQSGNCSSMSVAKSQTKLSDRWRPSC